MKKILSLVLAAIMLFSVVPMAYATEVSHDAGTLVTVVGPGGEYSVTVPATLEPGQTGTVTASGYWPSYNLLTVTAPKTLEVTNTKTAQTATINVNFDGIESVGNDLDKMGIQADISIDAGNARFGTWTGTLTYTVELLGPIEAYSYNGVKLPALPQWDHEDYPYALIHHSEGSTYTLYYFAKPIFEMSEPNEEDENSSPTIGYVNAISFVCQQGQDKMWQPRNGVTTSALFLDENLVWANFDVINAHDSSIYLAASKPVPVFECKS